MGFKAVRLLTETIVVTITILMAALSIYASQERFIDPQIHVFASLIGLFTIVIIIVNLFLTFYWASKLKAWFFVSIATFLLFIPYMTTMYQISFKTPPNFKERDICIATYNVSSFNNGHHYVKNFQNISFMFGEKDPDIICFQEIWYDNILTLDSISKFLEMPYYSIGENGLGVKDLAVFSKYPIKYTDHQVYPKTHNGSMFCDIQFKDKMVRVVNCHLQTTNFNQKKDEVRKLKQIFEPRVFAKAIQNLYKTITNNSKFRSEQALNVNYIVKTSPYPIIVCGDINETPSSFVYQKVKGELKDGFKEAGKGFGATYKKLFGILRVDYIFHSAQFECINFVIEKSNYSDHNPIFGFYRIL